MINLGYFKILHRTVVMTAAMVTSVPYESIAEQSPAREAGGAASAGCPEHTVHTVHTCAHFSGWVHTFRGVVHSTLGVSHSGQ